MDDGGLRKKKGCLGLVLFSSAMCSLRGRVVSESSLREGCRGLR